MSTSLGEVLLTPKQEALLRELASSAGGGGGLATGTDHDAQESNNGSASAVPSSQNEMQEAFYEHWFLLRTEPKRHEEDTGRSCWGSVEKMQDICSGTCDQLSGLLERLTELEHERQEVVRKTTALHEECEHMVRDQEQLGASAEAIAERLDLFDRVADVARVLDQGNTATSHPDFGSVLDQLDGSISFLEAHPEFCQSQAYLHQFEHLRNRACIAIRSAVQKSLEKSQAQVEQQVKEQADEGFADTQVFYARFKAAALNYKPLMGLLHKRIEAHETYAVTLEELEGFYTHLRIRLVSPPVTAHLQTMIHKDLPAHNLAPATQTAANYILDLSHFERQCFEAYFELRQPQEALRVLLETVAELFYKMVRPIVLTCESIDTLREMAQCLQTDIMEPNQKSSRAGDLVPVLGVVFRLLKDVQEKLIYRVEIYIRGDIRGCVTSVEDVNYPAMLYPLDPTKAGEDMDARDFQRGWFPSLRRTLDILAKIYTVVEISTFQGLAQEAVDVCLASLKQASQLLLQRQLKDRRDAFETLVRVMDSQLFLIKHLLILREQVSSFECDLIISEKYFDFSNFWDALHLKLPEGLLGILKPKLCQSQVDSKKDIETELKNACEVLVTNVIAHITQPLATLNSQIGSFLAQTADRVSLRDQPFMSLDKLRETTAAFLSNVREHVPFVAAHVRLYLASSKPGGPQMQGSSVQSTAALLFKPVEARLVDTCGRLESLLEEQRFSMAQFEEMGFLRPAALRDLVSSLFSAVMAASWADVVQRVSKVARMEIHLAPLPPPPPRASEGAPAQPPAPQPTPPPPPPPGGPASVPAPKAAAAEPPAPQPTQPPAPPPPSSPASVPPPQAPAPAEGPPPSPASSSAAAAKPPPAAAGPPPALAAGAAA
eukprot:CAMPEP_0178399632 /NCGR_PEP_ID=MMETSP0689_2-20121128/15378_1 /TAXON_ID=160604 /ORGANISM="Amphidinium massartii, Strain CS-259" /LENGTH=887 /DNA_ID=CAMNT_0020020411 /DNA_START=107 /DNA_END=2766 /DNA_ORIENTATION=-